MFQNNILLFGYGIHGKFIVKDLVNDGFIVQVIENDEKFYLQAIEDGFYDALQIDVTKDEELKALHPENYNQLICVMDDEHLNVFLTLSLRSLFEKSYILSISESNHGRQKLQMAGANRIIDLYEVSANKIHNILHRPVATKLLEEFVVYQNGIGFKEITIPSDSFLNGVMTDEMDFASLFDILLVGMIDEELGDGFIFITAGVNHKLDSGDTMVCLGEEKKLNTFETLIKNTEMPIDA